MLGSVTGEVIMACCELLVSCFFYNELTADMPKTTDYLRDMYCNGVCFTECTLYRISKVYGKDKVPKYLYPNDMNETLNFDLIKPDVDLDLDTFHKIIYTDGTSGMEKASTMGALRRTGKIVAFHWSGGWVEVRRKSKSPYNGVDRRKTKPEMLFDRFNSDESEVD